MTSLLSVDCLFSLDSCERKLLMEIIGVEGIITRKGFLTYHLIHSVIPLAGATEYFRPQVIGVNYTERVEKTSFGQLYHLFHFLP